LHLLDVKAFWTWANTSPMNFFFSRRAFIFMAVAATHSEDPLYFLVPMYLISLLEVLAWLGLL
jgi:hypothetical protein